MSHCEQAEREINCGELIPLLPVTNQLLYLKYLTLSTVGSAKWERVAKLGCSYR